MYDYINIIIFSWLHNGTLRGMNTIGKEMLKDVREVS